MKIEAATQSAIVNPKLGRAGFRGGDGTGTGAAGCCSGAGKEGCGR